MPAQTTFRAFRGRATLPILLTAGLALSGCSADDGTTAADEEAIEVTDALVATYDGGLLVIDGETLDVVEDIELDGFNRLNPAGDDRHVLVSTSAGFQVLDAAGAELTDDEFEGEEPGHVVYHAGQTVLFADGTGEITVFDPEELGDGLPEHETTTTEEPHHGVAVELSNGELLQTLGDEDDQYGIQVLDEEGDEIARNEDCPGTHGEAMAADETPVVGCEDGLLIYRDGEIEKVDSPDDYGRIGNQAEDKDSPYVLGDYKIDEDAELERPEDITVTDTDSGELELVDLGTSYSFRSLGRGPDGEGLTLGTDGELHVIDMEEAEVTDSFPVVDEWEEPIEWQDPRPTLFVRDNTAYVTEPEENMLHAVDLDSGEIVDEVELPEEPNEFTGLPAS